MAPLHRRRRQAGLPACIAAYAALVILVPLHFAPAVDDRVAAPTVAEAAHDHALEGLWHRYEAVADGDPVRFYYFHEGGVGLYRYGQVGLTNTHAFDYQADGEVVEFVFRKTGERRRASYSIERDGQREWLVLRGDPREPGETRYFRAGRGGQVEWGCQGGDASAGVGGRLWADQRRLRAGGLDFAIYQLQGQSIDGRGVGWFHRGDFDEWTTEALQFREAGDALALRFPVRGDAVTTPLARGHLGDGEDRRRTLTLAADPRDFGRSHRYVDAGPTFAAGPLLLPCEAP
ncbi:MAG: hypothetical protein KC636_30350 [Myxococcales bacterium]|nr:hypothetical protein [Myxococcales bacterium]